MTVRIGITLPTLSVEIDPVVEIARAADDHGLDAVSIMDHLFRAAVPIEGRVDATPRPAMEMSATLGMVLAETRRVAIITLVARVTIRPVAMLAHIFDTAQRIAGNGAGSKSRVIAGLGAGDRESVPEQVAYGLPVEPLDARVARLREAVEAVRAKGLTTWVGGTHPKVLDVARAADGWNQWAGEVAAFAARAAELPATVERSWGGLVMLGATDDDATDKMRRFGARPEVITGSPSTVAARLRPFVDAGATTLVLGPLDSSNLENVPLIAEVRERLQVGR